MKRRIVILTEIIAPYRIPLLNALAHSEAVDLRVIFLAETDPSLRQWEIPKEEIQFSYRVLPSWRRRVGRYNLLLNRGIGRALADAAPQVILCGGYSYVASWQALVWSRRRGIPFLLWSESNAQDLRHGHAPVEFLKRAFIRQCAGFVVPGQSASEYLRGLGVKKDVIFTAPNAVDNDLFGRTAADARLNSEARQQALRLPERYFVYSGRLVREKGIFDLLSAYAKLDDAVRQQVGLVFVGDGACRYDLEKKAASIKPGIIQFAGFAQRELLASYYGLALALVLPTYTDTWGLVVNEAMASALPVIVSRSAGCVMDLVRENCNGFVIPPGDVPALAGAMETLANHPELCKRMGAYSMQHISQYSPAKWSEGIVRAAEAAGACL